MYLGQIKFKCTACRNKFKGMATEYRATALAYPITCPTCGSVRTRPADIKGWLETPLYRKIWNDLENK